MNSWIHTSRHLLVNSLSSLPVDSLVASNSFSDGYNHDLLHKYPRAVIPYPGSSLLPDTELLAVQLRDPRAPPQPAIESVGRSWENCLVSDPLFG